MKESSITSNIISPLYVHNAMSDGEMVTGILSKINLTAESLNRIIPHEATDSQKVSRITKALLLEKISQRPIIIGIDDESFIDILNNYKPNMSSMISDNSATDVNKAISEAERLILIDGHHRYAASKVALNLRVNVDAWFWFVPFRQLKIKSFVKIFINGSATDINKIITRNYKISKKKPINDNNVLEILLYLKGYYYQLLLDSEKDFITEMNSIQNKMIQNQMVLFERHEISGDNDYLANIGNLHDVLVFKHTPFTHQMVLNIIAAGKVLPLHSTCFKPKPSHVSKNILNTSNCYLEQVIRAVA